MTINKEYWNIPKSDDVLSIPKGTNLTVFVDHADNAWLWGIGASDVTAIFSVLVAIIALGYSIYQGVKSRNHDRLTVKPVVNLYKNIIRITEGRDGKPCLRLVYQLKSCGLGPAQNINCNLKIGNELVMGSAKGKRPDLCEYTLNKFREELKDNILVGFDNVYPPEINAFKEITLPSGDSIELLRFDFKENESDPDAPTRLQNLIKVDFEYEDLYGVKHKVLRER